MRNGNNFKAKFFAIKFKNNWQLNDFLKFFDMSEEEFFAKMGTTFPAKTYQRLVRKLQRNEKKVSTEFRKPIAKVSKANEELQGESVAENEEDVEVVIQSCTDKLANFDQKLVEAEARREELEIEIEVLIEKRNELDKVIINISSN